MLNCPSTIRLDNENFPSGPSFVSRSFELFQLASIWTSQQHFRMSLSVQSALGFLSKTQIREDSCNCPDDVDSRLNVLIHKASLAFKFQTSEWQSSWSGRSSFIYGNCVHQMLWPGRSKPWYGNCVQLKYDRPDTRATLFGRCSI
jgi:hypothetical protein